MFWSIKNILWKNEKLEWLSKSELYGIMVNPLGINIYVLTCQIINLLYLYWN